MVAPPDSTPVSPPQPPASGVGPRGRSWALWLLVLIPFAALLWQPLRWGAILWFSSESQLAYQPFIPIGAAVLAWTRRDALRRICEDLARLFPDPDSPQRRGALLPLILSSGLFVAATVAVMPPLAIFAAILTVVALVHRLYGPFLLRALATPLCFLLLTIPLPNALVRRAVSLLQQLTTVFASQMLSVTGTPSQAQIGGVLLRENNVALPMDAAHSGLFLTASSFALCLLRLGIQPLPVSGALLLLALSLLVPETVNLTSVVLAGKVAAVQPGVARSLFALPSVVPLAVSVGILWLFDRRISRRRRPRPGWVEGAPG